jgi:hypothetical protein
MARRDRREVEYKRDQRAAWRINPRMFGHALIEDLTNSLVKRRGGTKRITMLVTGLCLLGAIFWVVGAVVRLF